MLSFSYTIILRKLSYSFIHHLEVNYGILIDIFKTVIKLSYKIKHEDTSS